MRRLLALALLCLGWSFAAPASAQSIVGPANMILCNKTVTFSGGAVAVQAVAPVTNARIAVCGWHVTSTSATSFTFTLTYGTQTTNPCDTGTVNITPALAVTQTAPSADHIDYAVSSSSVSQGLCVTPGNAALSGLIYYSQF